MNNIKTFIIIDSEDKEADAKLCHLLRCCDVSYTTGYCEDYDSPCDNKSCIWFLTSRQISFGSLFLGVLIGCNYKMISTDNCSFECNCRDVDLPMIEDVLELISNKM